MGQSTWGGDDLAKSPHIVRIANSVYRQMCPGDPTCSSFSRGQDGRPSPMMAESLLFKLHSAGMHEGVEVDPNRFKEVLSEKQDFAQLEDFNKKTDDTEYQKQYFENLNSDKKHRNRDAAPKKPVDTRKEWKPKKGEKG